VTDIEQKALALLNEVQADWNYLLGSLAFKRDRDVFSEALCRAIEQHEAFKQEVSNAVVCYFSGVELDTRLHRFIIYKPQPDPLVEVLDALKDGRAGPTTESYAHHIRAALDDLGFEIREKGQ
jgi:hypothetical protein